MILKSIRLCHICGMIHQTRGQRDIYRIAYKVVVALSIAANDSDKAIDSINQNTNDTLEYRSLATFPFEGREDLANDKVYMGILRLF